ncbi:MAG: DoxX family protein [Bacteroidales bacterium]|nr:DoxX family protein [Bacteroidales bacterium]
MKFLSTLSRIVIGLLFVFSGFTKAIDPVGFGFVFTEYLKTLGLDFFIPLALICAILVTAFEFMLGASLLVGLQVRLTAFFAMLFMVFFTFFTLWTAVANPVQHCGCFGDAIRLSNAETFLKNLIFTPFALFLVWQRKRFPPISLKIWECGAVAMFGIVSILLSLHCYRHLPLIDFAGFKVGNNIPQAMTVPPDAPQHQYETTFTYQKGTEIKAFTIDHLPDSTWTYLSAKTRLVKRGAIPEIPNFDVRTYRGRYFTDSLLSIQGPLLILIVPYADKAQAKALDKAGTLYRHGTELPFIVMSGSNEEHTAALLLNHSIDAPAYFSDAKTLYTMIRANPGLMLLHDANVVAKWSARDIPSPSAMDNLLAQDWEIVSAKLRINEHLSIEFFAVILIILLMILHPIVHRLHKTKRATDVL